VYFPLCAENLRFRFIGNGVADAGGTPADAASFRTVVEQVPEVNAN